MATPESLYAQFSDQYNSRVVNYDCIVLYKIGNRSFFIKIDLVFVFSVFIKQTSFLQQINVKNIHPVYDAGIASFIPWPQDQWPIL